MNRSIGEFDSRICSMDEGFRCTLMALQRAIANVKNQLNGVYVILDFKGFGLHQIGQYSPTFMKKFSSLVQVNLYSVQLKYAKGFALI